MFTKQAARLLLLVTATIAALVLGAVHCDDKPLVLVDSVTGLIVDAGAPIEHWEYKVLVVNGPTHETTGPNASATNEIPVDETALDGYGNNGWELTTSWLEPETTFPVVNVHAATLGSYQAAMSNVRPGRAVLLFKRRTK